MRAIRLGSSLTQFIGMQANVEARIACVTGDDSVPRIESGGTSLISRSEMKTLAEF
jgi:hypothetical protein